jgi:hypothetical protein
MTLKEFIIWMLLGTLICWAAFGIVIYTTNPFEAGALAFIFFYITLILSMTGSLTLVGLFTRIFVLKRDDFVARRVTASFRQGIFLSFVLAAGLLLMSKDLLTWWNITLFVLGITLLEFFFISSKRLS